jgi:rhodanese-related sulfurtransferase
MPQMSLGNGSSGSGQSVPEVQASAVPDGGWLLDVREPDEWAAGHAPDAKHIPLRELQARSAEVPADRAIYVICQSGHRSALATEALNAAGWQAVNVAGGMQQWAAAGRVMVSEKGAQPYVA